MKLIFDATIIAVGANNNSRTGLYFTALNILKELLAHSSIELSLYCDSKRYKDLTLELERLFPENVFEILTNTNSTYLLKKHFELYKYKQEIRYSGKRLKKITVQIKLLLISLLLKLELLCSKFASSSEVQYDFFLSPVYKIPQTVKKLKVLNKGIVLYDIVPILFPDLNEASQKGSWYCKLLETLNSKDYYFAISESTRQDYLKYCPQIDSEKIKTALLACDDKFRACSLEEIVKAKLKYNIPMNKKYVFSLCTLEPRKNLVRTVKTFIEFIKKNNIKDLVFVLGGGHWKVFINELNKEIETLGDYQDKILKIGYVDDADLAPLYSGAEWFTYTSQYEGFGLPPLEAMSCGCPVITSNNSSLPEVVGGAGIMIDWDSDEQHIEAYEKYYFNKELRAEFAQKGLERSKHFSWEKCVDDMVTIFKN